MGTKTAAEGGGIVPLRSFDAAKVGIIFDMCKKNGEKVQGRGRKRWKKREIIRKRVLFKENTCTIILKLVPLHRVNQANYNMKYRELEKIVRGIGCYDTGRQQAGHPLWHSPVTGKDFQMSNHRSEEVATGTLNGILKAAGLK